MLTAIEFFSGIGGFAHAAKGRIEVKTGFEISPHCVKAYNAQFEHRSVQVDLNSTSVAVPDADLWWISAPCTPFTRRGPQRDLTDHRAEPFVAMMDRVRDHLPKFVCMENVEAFEGSDAHRLFLETVNDHYDIREQIVCPTEFGIPNKRPRYYAIASRTALPERLPIADEGRTFSLNDLMSMTHGALVAEKTLQKYGRVMHVVDENSEYTTCFTGGYAKSWVYAGSFVASAEGPRLFSPEQIAFALGFPEISWPDEFSTRQRFKYLGNSLSVFVVERILDGLLEAI